MSPFKKCLICHFLPVDLKQVSKNNFTCQKPNEYREIIYYYYILLLYVGFFKQITVFLLVIEMFSRLKRYKASLNKFKENVRATMATINIKTRRPLGVNSGYLGLCM